MSWNFGLKMDTGAGEFFYGFDVNHTSNCNPMLGDVGIIWDELDGKQAKEARAIIAAGLEKLQNDPVKYEAMNPPNGWGSYETLCKVIQEILIEVTKHPLAIVSVGQ